MLTNLTVKNFYDNKKEASITPLHIDNISEQDLKRIVELCNQKAIYDFLFKSKLKGKAYEIKNAKGFVKWASSAWDDQTSFPFIIRTADSQIIGAIDIKSNNKEYAEVGYWMDTNSKGYMTNALVELTGFAMRKGFKKLFADALPNNVASQGVLTRAQFTYIKSLIPEGETKIYKRYERELA